MTDRRTIASFAAVSVLFGGTFVAAKAGLAHFPPLLFVALRFDVAAVVLLGYVAVTRSRADLIPRTRGDLGGIVATGLFTIGLANALLFVGQQYVTSGVASIIASLNPILTPVFAAVLLSDERLSPRGVAGMALGLIGVGLVANPDPGAVLSGGMVGEAIMLGNAVAGALGAVLIRRADADLSSTVRTAWGLPLAAGVSHLGSLALGESPAAITWTPGAVLALGYVALFAGVLAYIAYFGLIDDVGAIRANLAFYAVPVVASLGGWLFLDETVPPLAFVGFAVVFAGFGVVASESVDRPLRAVARAVDRVIPGPARVASFVDDLSRSEDESTLGTEAEASRARFGDDCPPQEAD